MVKLAEMFDGDRLRRKMSAVPRSRGPEALGGQSSKGESYTGLRVKCGLDTEYQRSCQVQG